MPIGHMRQPALITLLLSQSCRASVESMVAGAQKVLEHAKLEETLGKDQRFAVAARSADKNDAVLGVYGEFPLRAVAEVLEHPAVAASTSFVDFGSGAGRLLLGVSGMREWRSCVGVEALQGLHAIADKAIATAEADAAIEAGTVRAVHAGGLPHLGPAADLSLIHI